MGQIGRNLSKGELRAWLKSLAGSNLAERIPFVYEPRGVSVVEYARTLLTELRNSDASGRPVFEILVEVRGLRDWVEARLKAGRRTILAEQSAGPDVVDFARRTAVRKDSEAALDRIVMVREQGVWRERRRDARPPVPRPTRPQADPMWDEFLDGL